MNAATAGATPEKLLADAQRDAQQPGERVDAYSSSMATATPTVQRSRRVTLAKLRARDPRQAVIAAFESGFVVPR